MYWFMNRITKTVNEMKNKYTVLTIKLEVATQVTRAVIY